MRFELMYESFFKIIEGIPLTLQVVSISTVLVSIGNNRGIDENFEKINVNSCLLFCLFN